MIFIIKDIVTDVTKLFTLKIEMTKIRAYSLCTNHGSKTFSDT